MLRACCVNHRSRREDFECMVDKIKEIATKLRQQTIIYHLVQINPLLLFPRSLVHTLPRMNASIFLS